MENNLWQIFSDVFRWAIMPVILALSYFVRKYLHKVDKLENRLAVLEVRTSVVESKIDDIKDDIKEIKHGVARLIDRK